MKKKKIQNLITLLTLFKDKPNLLAEYLMEFDALSDNFMDNISNNKELSKMWEELDSSGEIEVPFFFNIEMMDRYYRNLFKSDKKFKQMKNKKEEELIIELKKALLDEDYEKASKIRDYFLIKNINIQKFL